MRVGGLPRSVVLLALTSLFGDVSTEMLYPVLPLFLTRELAAPASAVGVNLGAVLGPLVATALLYVLLVPLRSMFFIAFIPGTIAFLLVMFVRETPRPAAARTRGLGLRALPPEYWRYLAGVAVFGVGNLSSAFAILRATDLGLRTEQTLLVYAAYNFVAALVS